MRKLWKRFTSVSGSKPLQENANNKAHLSVSSVITPVAEDEVISYIRASPQYYSAYLSQRNAILKRVLFDSIHPDVLFDAFSAIDSTKIMTSNRKDRAARVRSFLSDYKDNREKWAPPEHLDLESLYRLARLQNHVQHSTEDLCRIATSSHQFPGTQIVHSEELSMNESRRFYRAFYRFDIFCNLFRNWKTPPDDELLSNASNRHHENPFQLEPLEKSSRFLGLFSPWEVEELACVRDYFFNYYRRMLHKFKPDLRERNPHLDLSEDGNDSSLNNQRRKRRADWY